MTVEPSVSEPATKVTSNVPEVPDVGYPRGHLGRLDEHQEAQLAAFRTLLKENGLYKPSHDDPTLLRFLRARKWIPEDAFAQLKVTEEWRAANDIDVLYRTIELDAYDQCHRLYPQWLGRRDRRGIPIYLLEVKKLDNKSVSDYEEVGKTSTFSQAKVDGKTPPGLLRLFAQYENLTRFCQPFATQLQDRELNDIPITLSTNIVDISGVSLKQFFNLKGHMLAASQLAQAHYPETLDRIYILGAPVFFSIVWGWIKRWFDPVTVSKIYILSSHEVFPVLSQFIDPLNIPKQYGGELDFNYGDQPTVDPAWGGFVSWEEGHSSFTARPAVWRPSKDGTRMECVGIGSVDGVEQHELICSVPKAWPHPSAGVPAAELTPAATPAAKEGSVSEESPAEPAGARAEVPVLELQKLSVSDNKEAEERPAEGGAAPAAPGLA